MEYINSGMVDLEIPTQTVNQRAYDRLCELIFSGHLRFGERLDERILAERMKISRTPIREAIGRLATEGIIERRPYQGNFVRNFTPLQIHNLYEVRKELEGLAVRLALETATGSEIDELGRIIGECHQALSDNRLLDFERLDQQFHGFLTGLSRNETLIECLENLRLKVQLARHYANEAPDAAQRTVAERNAILKAFREKDVETAVAQMKLHIDGAREAFAERVSNEELPARSA
ncbi:GntR family transcriptional regulator [Aliihoeflea sp. PC F10.4]